MVGKKLADWHEGRSAIRMLAAALGAYLATTVIHLPGPYSAVITTLVVARPHSGGVLRASFERLTATILGAGIACAATFGRMLHTPELLLIGLTLSPLALIAAHNSAYRTAMIAAMIVFSAPATAGAQNEYGRSHRAGKIRVPHPPGLARAGNAHSRSTRCSADEGPGCRDGQIHRADACRSNIPEA
jgi:hypothetical protein